MQFASQGIRFLFRNATSAASHTGQTQAASNVAHHSHKVHLPSSTTTTTTTTTTSGISRGFHHQTANVRAPPSNAGGTAQTLFTHSKHIASQLLAHLAAPGIRAPLPRTYNPPIPPRVTVQQSIRDGFSLPVRHALRNPSVLQQRTFLPRPPVIPPRSVVEVGLGTARRFHTSRPMFQNLVENVPIVGRAFYEVDWEMKMEKEKEMMKFNMLREKGAKKVKAKSKEMSKPREANKAKDVAAPAVSISVPATPSVGEELSQYFSAPTPQVATYLLVPLAPTPTNRTPLQENPPPSASALPPKLLPLADLASMQNEHHLHSLRVQTLFTRLDAGRVWDKGVQCSSYSHMLPSYAGGGVCNVLKLEFAGWTKEDVLKVIGESGRGWCVLEEVRITYDGQEDSIYSGSEEEGFEDDDAFSEASFMTGTSMEWDGLLRDQDPSATLGGHVDPAQSLVMPSLDLSSTSGSRSTFVLSTSTVVPPSLSRRNAHTVTDMPYFSPPQDAEFDPWIEVGSFAPPSGRASRSASVLSSPAPLSPPSISDWESGRASEWEFSRVGSPEPRTMF